MQRVFTKFWDSSKGGGGGGEEGMNNQLNVCR